MIKDSAGQLVGSRMHVLASWPYSVETGAHTRRKWLDSAVVRGYMLEVPARQSSSQVVVMRCLCVPHACFRYGCWVSSRTSSSTYARTATSGRLPDHPTRCAHAHVATPKTRALFPGQSEGAELCRLAICKSPLRPGAKGARALPCWQNTPCTQQAGRPACMHAGWRMMQAQQSSSCLSYTPHG